MKALLHCQCRFYKQWHGYPSGLVSPSTLSFCGMHPDIQASQYLAACRGKHSTAFRTCTETSQTWKEEKIDKC